MSGALWWVRHTGHGQWSPRVPRASPGGQPRSLGRGGAGSWGTESLCLSLAFSWPWGESPGQRAPCSPVESGSPPVSTEPGLSQAPPSGKLIRFPRRDAEREGQIELGVPGIRAREQACRVPVRPARSELQPLATLLQGGRAPSPWHLQQLDLRARALAALFTSILSPSLNF